MKLDDKNIDKSNITFIIEVLNKGGAERVTSLLANSFSEKNYNVNIIIFKKSSNEYFTNLNVKKIYLKPRSNKNIINRAVSRIKEINSILKETNTNVVISLAEPTTNICLITKLLNKDIKIILSERNDPNIYPKNKIIRKIKHLLFYLSDCTVFQTETAKKFFGRKVGKKGVVIPNPLKEDLPQIYNGERKKIIVNFCRLEPQKNLYMLIDAFILLLNDHSDYILEIYGEGYLEQELIMYVRNKLCEKNIFIKKYELNIHEKIRDYSMYVSSSNYEGISNSMLESLAIGLPTISTDCSSGGARMFIKDHITGILVPVGDKIKLYKAMKEIIENSDLSKKISLNSIRIRDELSKEKIFLKWENIINEILNN